MLPFQHGGHLLDGAQGLALYGSGGGWSTVAAPDSAFDWLPFAIHQNGADFRADPDFDLQTYANITVAKTYYVDQSTGNDSNSGADWDNALANLSTAMLKADVDRIYVRNSYFYKNQRASWPARSIEIIAPDRDVTISSDVTNQIGAWSLVDSHYEATIAEYIAGVADFANLDAFSNPGWLTDQASIAAVDATANSKYVDWPGRKVYVHTFDLREPDANVKFYDSVGMTITRDNITAYVEGCEITPYMIAQNLSASGGTKTYLKDCTLTALLVAGVDEIIMQGCTITNAGADCVNYDARNAVVPNVAEIGCVIYDNHGNAANQASTAHNGCSVVTLNAVYHDVSGQVIADAGATTTRWCLGSALHDSTSGIGLYTEGKAWLDHVHSYNNNAYDLQNIAGATIYTRACTLEKGLNDIGGALSTY